MVVEPGYLSVLQIAKDGAVGIENNDVRVRELRSGMMAREYFEGQNTC